ncbi:hypothetical protein [Streptomyces griseorubiginosus]|uniref:hypothetical protein n=1 Tax=Streptomyces griseorubiginosus TaxID=67304 RepID=UPI0036E8E04E
MIYPAFRAGARWLLALAVYVPAASASIAVWAGLRAIHAPQPLASFATLLMAAVSTVVITYGIENVLNRRHATAGKPL